MKRLQPGDAMDGFIIEALVHTGGMADIYRVHYDDNRADPGFPMVMKVPRMASGDGAENIVSFEVEHRLLQTLSGPHVPRFVAAGDLTRLPYLVIEYIAGETLQKKLDHAREAQQALSSESIAHLGYATAMAAHSLHQQNVVHLDLKPANVMIHPDGQAVLLDFGLSWHAHFPDLLAEEMRKAIGSPAWIAPEQVVGVRGDPRSDIFAIGVMLYELTTGELPFDVPQTQGGLRQRLWMDPPPPRRLRPDTPPWLQQIILRCLEPEAQRRYPSAAHLAFDLANPDQVKLGPRAATDKSTPFLTHFKRWIKAAGMQYQPSPLPVTQIDAVPIVMVAIPHEDVSDATLFSLRESVNRSLGIRPGARLACVTVIKPSDHTRPETETHREHLDRLRRWSQGLNLANHQISFHVLEASDVAHALLAYARGNQVSLMVLGAATHGLRSQRLIATVPMKVVMDAPCSVLLVRQRLPFEHLGDLSSN